MIEEKKMTETLCLHLLHFPLTTILELTPAGHTPAVSLTTNLFCLFTLRASTLGNEPRPATKHVGKHLSS